jgi:hypothetical protein
MTLEQIKDEIRSLRSSDRIELYRWLDYGVVADYGVATDFCPRIGMDRSLEIRHAIEQNTTLPIPQGLKTAPVILY